VLVVRSLIALREAEEEQVAGVARSRSFIGERGAARER